MLSLGRLVAAPTVVACLFVGSFAVLWAATAADLFVTIVGAAGGLFFYLAALATTYLLWLKRVNAEIDADRYEIRQELERLDEE